MITLHVFLFVFAFVNERREKEKYLCEMSKKKVFIFIKKAPFHWGYDGKIMYDLERKLENENRCFLGVKIVK